MRNLFAATLRPFSLHVRLGLHVRCRLAPTRGNQVFTTLRTIIERPSATQSKQPRLRPRSSALDCPWPAGRLRQDSPERHWSRGFIEVVGFDPRTLEACREEAFDHSPTRRLILTGLGNKADALALVPPDHRLTALELIDCRLDLRGLRRRRGHSGSRRGGGLNDRTGGDVKDGAVGLDVGDVRGLCRRRRFVRFCTGSSTMVRCRSTVLGCGFPATRCGSRPATNGAGHGSRRCCPAPNASARRGCATSRASLG